MKKSLILILSMILIYQCGNNSTAKTTLPTDFVDPFIGTSAHGHTFPGATLPFGMVQLSPDTDINGWDWCSGYHSSDNSIKGFSHKHLSGTGCSDFGDILFMPTIGEVKLNSGTKENPEIGYRSTFTHVSEIAYPGYYKVQLDDYNITAELSTSLRTGVHQYTFPKSDQSNIIIDLISGIQDRPTDAYLKINGKNEVVGYRESTGWARKHCVYFVAKFSKDFENYGFEVNNQVQNNKTEFSGKKIVGHIGFTTEQDEKVIVKVGISGVSIEGARKNLETETLNKSFDQVKNEAKEQWNKHLNSIEVEATNDVKTVFYTALYHSLIAPNTYMDVDGKYKGMDGKVHTAENFTNYTVFSLWDTFRAAHPLFTILYPNRVNDMMNTFIKKYEQSGLLPVWELDANETNCMIGYNAIPVILDAYAKGIDDYDVEKIYEAMKASSMQDIRGTDYFRDCSFISGELEVESVSKNLEYAYNDWCIAEMARLLKQDSDYQYYINRAQFYLNLFDEETGFMRPKRYGKFSAPFNPKAVTGDYTEANAWQYSFFVPQDIKKLIEIYGGEKSFEDKLDQLFTETSNIDGRHQADITGLIGQYAHGNEPSHHMAYLYNFIGKPWKTQEVVRKIMTELYTSERDGICGNEDCGQMSAWYVLNALGFYPVTPGNNNYIIGSPMVKHAKINLLSGNELIINVQNQSYDNVYIEKLLYNGKEFSNSYFNHTELMKGGEFTFIMSNKPNKQWASTKATMPITKIEENFTPVPYFEYENLNFLDKQTVGLFNIDDNANIYYSIDDGKYIEYSTPFEIEQDIKISTYSLIPNHTESDTVHVSFKKIKYKRDIQINSKYSDKYHAGGDIGLVDFVLGTENLLSGYWQGYEGQDFEAIVDLRKVQNVDQISTRYIQVAGSWVFLPKDVIYSISTDGKNYKKLKKLTHNIPLTEMNTTIKEFKISNIEQNARYIKVNATGVKVCPDWHAGAGGPAWLFIDEITIN